MSEELALTTDPQTKSHHFWKRAASLLVALCVLYFFLAYVVAPYGWKRYVRKHPSFDDNPRITQTKDGHPGDALNVALIGTQTQLERIMKDAKWYPADPLGIRSDLKIAEATVFERQYDDAPVSNLYLFGRKEDLAFEQPVGDDPRKRHHVRFWQAPKPDESGRPIWMGSAIFDDRVGISRTTGQITHHTAADIDTERDYLFKDLNATGDLSESYFIDNFHTKREGKNGGGDPWHTDGRLEVGVIEVK